MASNNYYAFSFLIVKDNYTNRLLVIFSLSCLHVVLGLNPVLHILYS